MRRLDHYWYSQNGIAWLLSPVSLLYCVVVRIRRFLYQHQIVASAKLSRPVIIVGNISVGGTGKTPLLIALCELLKSKGINPGVTSRGYRSSLGSGMVHQVSISDTAQEVGDEPYLIMHRSKCPVVISDDRSAAGRYLIENNACDVILSDDGLQHYKLQRDLEIAVVDADRGFGNGFCIPAGPLREPLSRLDTVDQVIMHLTDTDRFENENQSGFVLRFSAPLDINNGAETTLENLKREPVHAVAGIGHPQRFFQQLRANGFEIIEHAFADHHAYSNSDLHFNDSKAIIMTEKDAVKCKTLGLNNAWSIPVTAILSDDLQQSFLKSTEALIDA